MKKIQAVFPPFLGVNNLFAS